MVEPDRQVPLTGPILEPSTSAQNLLDEMDGLFVHQSPSSSDFSLTTHWDVLKPLCQRRERNAVVHMDADIPTYHNSRSSINDKDIVVSVDPDSNAPTCVKVGLLEIKVRFLDSSSQKMSS